MPRTYIKKGVHTSPKTAGIKNMPSPDSMPRDEDNLMAKLMPVYNHGAEEFKRYGGQWTEEQFKHSIKEFFDYCSENNVKPVRPGLQLWLGASRGQYYDWRFKPEKYGYKSDAIEWAEQAMEAYLMGNMDKYPTGSIFLLKTSHGHVEQSKLDITTDGKAISGSKEEMDDTIRKLGLME